MTKKEHMDISTQQYQEFKDVTLNFISKIILNAVIAQNMIKDGKEWHAVNKMDGVLDQLNLLANRFSQFPECLAQESADVDASK